VGPSDGPLVGALLLVTGVVSGVWAWACLSGRYRRWVRNPVASWMVIGLGPSSVGAMLIGASLIVRSVPLLWVGLGLIWLGAGLALWSPKFLYPTWAQALREG
jgi:hypothetical protein